MLRFSSELNMMPFLKITSTKFKVMLFSGLEFIDEEPCSAATRLIFIFLTIVC
jgi:hypothetical protein